MSEVVLNKFYSYVLENINSDTGEVYISEEIDDENLLNFVEKTGLYFDENMNLEDLLSSVKKNVPKDFICESDLLISYDAGIEDENGSILLLHRFGEKGIIQSYLTGGYETFLFGQFELELDGDRIDLANGLIDMIQWEDAPYIQLNSLYINENYINLDDFFNHIYSNLVDGLADMLISLNCHTNHIETKVFFKRLSKAEKEEVLKIDKHGYDWDSYDEELLKSAFVKGILKMS